MEEILKDNASGINRAARFCYLILAAIVGLATWGYLRARNVADVVDDESDPDADAAYVEIPTAQPEEEPSDSGVRYEL